MNKSSSSEDEIRTVNFCPQINYLLNPLIDNKKYQEYSDKERKSFTKLQNNIKEETQCNFNERIIYNSISNDCVINSNLDTTNTYYYKNYLVFKEDFNYENYMNLINIRQNYLVNKLKLKQNEKSAQKEENDQKEEKTKDVREGNKKKISEDLFDSCDYESEKSENSLFSDNIFDSKEEKSEDDSVGNNSFNYCKDGKKEDKILDKNKEEGKKEDNIFEEKISGYSHSDLSQNFLHNLGESLKKEKEEEIKAKEDSLYSLLADLQDMMDYKPDENKDPLLYYTILERIFNNIFFEIQTSSNEENKLELNHSKLYECIDLLEKKFITKEEKINDKIILILYQLQKISLLLKSCGCFLRILEIMKSNNIVFNNYQLIYQKYFQIDLANAMKKIRRYSLKDKTIKINNDIRKFEYCIDNNYLFLCHDIKDKNNFKLIRYELNHSSKCFGKEILYDFNISMINDYNRNTLDILIYKNNNEFELLIINKNDLSIEKAITILSPIKTGEFTQMITSLSFFYLISDKLIYRLDISTLNKTLEFIPFITLKKTLNKDESYFFVLDDYILFEKYNIDLKNKIIVEENENKNLNSNKNYFDNFSNYFYMIKYNKAEKKFQIQIYYFEQYT